MKLAEQLLALCEGVIKVSPKVLEKIRRIEGVVNVGYDKKINPAGHQLMDIETKTGFLQFLLAKDGGSIDTALSKKNAEIAKEVLIILRASKLAE